MIQRWLPLLLSVALLANSLVLALGQWRLSLADPALVESTPGQLGLWVAGQTEEPGAESILVQVTRPTVRGGVLSETAALARARLTLGFLGLGAAFLSLVVAWFLWRQSPRSRDVTLWLLLTYDALLLNVPAVTERPFYGLALAGVAACLLLLFFAPGRLSPTLGFIIVVSAILAGWEVYKAVGSATGNRLPLTDFPWKLPHWQDIAETLLQPARRNGPFLLLRILAEAALVTWREAFVGFAFGSLLGFVLGILFARAHHRHCPHDRRLSGAGLGPGGCYFGLPHLFPGDSEYLARPLIARTLKIGVNALLCCFARRHFVEVARSGRPALHFYSPQNLGHHQRGRGHCG
jgi:hypothetical protein